MSMIDTNINVCINAIEVKSLNRYLYNTLNIHVCINTVYTSLNMGLDGGLGGGRPAGRIQNVHFKMAEPLSGNKSLYN